MRALVLGATGQDGSYTTEFLLEKGYEVHVFIRRSATGNTRNIDHLLDRVTIHWGDLSDTLSIEKAIRESNPDEIYNQADQDLATRSWDVPQYNANVTASAAGEILRIIKGTPIKLIQPISSNIFGDTSVIPQNENTTPQPKSPYACAKAHALHLARMYRDLGAFVSCPILYNHESVRRTEEYVTRKISKSVARIVRGEQRELILGDTSSLIDWGWAPEYVEAEWKMLQLKKPDDFIICTGELHSVQEFVELAFSFMDLEWKDYVRTSPSLLRPIKNSQLLGDTSKAKATFGFDPQVKFKDIVGRMVTHDVQDSS